MVTPERLCELLEQGGQDLALTLREAHELCEQYPYFHAAQLLRATLEALQSETGDTAGSAALVPQRLSLYSMLHGAPCAYEAPEEFPLEGSWDWGCEVAEGAEATQVTQALDEPASAVGGTGGQEAAPDFTVSAEEGELAQAEVEEFAPADAEVESTDLALSSADGAPVDSEASANAALPVDSEEQTDSVGNVRGDGAVETGLESTEGTADVPSIEAEPVVEVFGTLVEELPSQQRAEDAQEASGASSGAETAILTENMPEDTASGDFPPIDLTGVLDYSLAQEVPGMAPIVSTLGDMDFTITQKDIEYINTYLNAQWESGEGQSASSEFGDSPSQADRINSFIDQMDDILTRVLEEEKAHAADGDAPDDFAASQQQLDSGIASERLAQLLAGKGEYEVAISMYERLLAKNPEKSSYFAGIIEGLKREKEKN